MIDLTPILEAVIGLVAALITVYLIPWIKSKTTVNQQQKMAALVRTLVYAAEQLYGKDKGAEKLAYVVNELNKRGFTIDRAAIEAAVHEMNIGAKLFEFPEFKAEVHECELPKEEEEVTDADE